jgi:hypothetical protein
LAGAWFTLSKARVATVPTIAIVAMICFALINNIIYI